ncbi:MAG: hypothetical protein JWR89_4586 [Tardiphaga sp.]|jgi:hypothetical protein|nr:hypothetical protein [Tardiphaga sp.]
MPNVAGAARTILGSPDEMKFRSSMKLFGLADAGLAVTKDSASNAPSMPSIFSDYPVLIERNAYGGELPPIARLAHALVVQGVVQPIKKSSSRPGPAVKMEPFQNSYIMRTPSLSCLKIHRPRVARALADRAALRLTNACSHLQ